MEELPTVPGETIDHPSLSLREQVRQRFVAALNESLPGSPLPDPEKFLDAVVEPERSELRSELDSLAAVHRQGRDIQGSGSGVASVPDSGATSHGPRLAGGSVDFVSAAPGEATETVVPEQTIPSPSLWGTVEYGSRDPDGPSDHPSGPRGAGKPPAPRGPETVAGYEILGVLGRGAMGVVYKARQPRLKRVVALKMILAGGYASAQELGRFRSEAEAVAQIQHPNIVQIYEVGDEDGRPFFSLEYVEGGSLADKIAGAPQPPREAAEITRLLAEAMACAHQKGIIHRDLKPANVLLTPEGSPKISDFGLAKKVEEDSGHTRTGAILGSPSYMAPEQAEGRIHEVGPLADVYSLGAILYELLTGRPPFRNATILETLQQVRTQEPVAPRQLVPRVPADLETICLKCLHKERGKRYAGAGELAEDLRRFLAGEPIQARPVGRWERLWRWCKRNPRVALLSATMVALVVAWAVTSSVLAWQLNEQKNATARQAAIATEKALEASQKAAEAREAAALAKKNQDLAIRRADVAKGSYQTAISTMIGLIEQVQNRLRSKRLPTRTSPEVRRLREELFAQIRKTLAGMNAQMVKSEATPFSTVSTCQHLGDLFRRLGQRQEALEQYQLGYRLIKQAAEARPNDDVAQANLGVMLLRLADMALDLDGDAQAARAYQVQARQLHQQVHTNPRSRYYKEVAIRRILSHDDMHLGKTELQRGDPAAARQCFEASLSNRTFWLKVEPNSDEARSYVMEAHLWLGIACSHLGDAPGLREHFGQATQLGLALVQKHPRIFDFQSDLAETCGALGEAQFRLGMLEAAEKSCRLALTTLEPVLAHDPDDVARDPFLALTYERLAAVNRRLGKRPEAEKYFQQALQVREDLLQIEPNNPTWQTAHLLALARCGKHAEAAGGAEKLRQRVTRSTELLLQLARCYAVCAAATNDPAQKKRYVEKALEALGAATKEAYKDVVVLRSDPDLEALRPEAPFQALLARLGKAPQ